jgi:hypothetical protein
MLVSAIVHFEGFAHELVGLGSEEHDVAHEESGVGADEEDAHVGPSPLPVQSSRQITDVDNFLTLESISGFEQYVDAEQVDERDVDEAYERADQTHLRYRFWCGDEGDAHVHLD